MLYLRCAMLNIYSLSNYNSLPLDTLVFGGNTFKELKTAISKGVYGKYISSNPNNDLIFLVQNQGIKTYYRYVVPINNQRK